MRDIDADSHQREDREQSKAGREKETNKSENVNSLRPPSRLHPHSPPSASARVGACDPNPSGRTQSRRRGHNGVK
uniref:Uncharacterized protein n=1 Tax=Anopheles arabiensis TaxID=7173 RepID=A0A182IFA0_ANOAR